MMFQWTFVFLGFLGFSWPSITWEAHYLLTYEALKDVFNTKNEQNIEAETLDAFVLKEKKGLEVLLKEHELAARRNLTQYAPLPQKLAFKAKNQVANLTKQFLLSLRLNPDIDYPLFILTPPIIGPMPQSFAPAELKEAPLSTLALVGDGRALKKVLPGQKLSALEIIASATEEPDHGMDFDLWEDNNSWYGALYNFGRQPFGNARLSFGTQAPFHMGFYHEPSILYALGSFIKRCYPEYRISQFVALSRYAFASGHPYWGYRFLGIADHYKQDLTQVYHARLAPGLSIAQLISTNLLALAGFLGPKNDATQLLTNRHLGLENYQLGFMRAALLDPKGDRVLLSALRDQSQDSAYGSYSDNYARMVIAKEAYDRAAIVDSLVLEALPSRLSNPEFVFEGTAGIDLYAEANEKPSEASGKLKAVFISMMRAFGAHTRQSVRYVLNKY